MAQVFKNVQLAARPPEAPKIPAVPVRDDTAAADAKKEEASAREELLALRAELEAQKAAARKEGFQAGYEEGLSAAQAKLALDMARFDRLFKDLHAQSLKPLLEQDATLVEIVLAAIARLVGEQLADRQQALKIVRQALNDYGDKQVTALYLSSEDYDQMHEAGLHFDDYPQLKIYASPKVKLGGCLIETSNGIADARVETQIERIRAILHHARVSAQEAASRDVS